MIGKRRQALRRKGGKGFLFIYRGVPKEEVRLKNQKWRDANWPVFGVNLDIIEVKKAEFEKYFMKWVDKYGVTSLEIDFNRSECGKSGKKYPKFLYICNNFLKYFVVLNRYVATN